MRFQNSYLEMLEWWGHEWSESTALLKDVVNIRRGLLNTTGVCCVRDPPLGCMQGVFSMVRFYELSFDDDLTRWQLGLARRFADGTPVDIWAYRRCTIIESSRPVPLEVTRAGKEVDYNDTAFSATVVSERLAEIWKSFTPGRIQLLPAEIARSSSVWYVANFLDCVDCIDHARSRIKYCPADDPDRPLKPRAVMRMVIDCARAEGHHLFRVVDWKVAVIVSAELREAMEERGFSGVEYEPASEE
jgi:hypothetical protein